MRDTLLDELGFTKEVHTSFAEIETDNPWERISQSISSKIGATLPQEVKTSTTVLDIFKPYKTDAAGYIRTFLRWEPWQGTPAAPGQVEVIDAYNLAIKQQLERYQWETAPDQARLEVWQPGQDIQNWIRVESGNLVGKTKLAGGVVSQFVDCFDSIVYTFAPSAEQLNDLLWKEIRADRRQNNLPGQVLDIPRLKYTEDRFATGKATSNANSTGIERIQGQHNPYLMFVLDEAEGIPEFVYDSIEGMDAGVVVIVLLLANPRTRGSTFHKIRNASYVINFRISTLTHPNVVTGKPLIRGAATRDWVNRRIEKYCDEVTVHNPDEFTFEVPWWPGVIYKPYPEFYWRVLGVAPETTSDDTLCPIGRYEAAKARDVAEEDEPTQANIGMDAARYGNDKGTIYCLWNGAVWRERSISKRDGFAYYVAIKELCEWLAEQEVDNISIRIDAGGGYGGTAADNLRRDEDLIKKFETFQVLEINNGGRPKEVKRFADRVTELYYHAGQRLKYLQLRDAPEELEADLCYRRYAYVLKKGRSVMKLEKKEQFKKRYKRSPDDGDGLAYCLGPRTLFRAGGTERMVY